MTVTTKSMGRILGSTAGAVLAGPGGAVVGSLTGGLLATILPDFLSNVAGELTADAVERAGNALVNRLNDKDRQRINHDLQTAFRDALREAIYDVGGRVCFPDQWNGKRQDILERVVYAQTSEGHGLWRAGSPRGDLAQQVCDCLQAMDRAIEEQQLLPLAPPQDQPLTDVQHFLEAETPEALANDFFDQVLAPFLTGFRSLTLELPHFESHLRSHLLDRTLVHLGEMLKQRTPAWRAFNRLLLEGVRTEVRQLGVGQEQILKRLDTLLARPETQPLTDWANGLADLVSAVGRMEKRLDEGFDALLTRVTAQHGEVLARLADLGTAVQGVAYQVSMVGADVQAIFPKLEEIIAYVRGGSLTGFTAQGDRLLAEPRPPRAMLRERQAHYLERHRLFAGREAEVAHIREFLQTHPQGYVFVTGPSGYGKSALLANLITPDPEQYVWYFINQLDGTHRPLDFLRQMCEQLLAYYQMPVQSEYDLPDRVDRLEALYAQLLRMPLVRTDQPLILVIDGVDEAEASFLSDLHIPRDLPDGKFIVFSARQTGRDYIAELGLPREHLLTLTLGEMDYEAIRALLWAADGQATIWANDPDLVGQLARISQGDPFYLHYLVQDIVADQMTLEQIEHQPEGLTTYLDGWWKQVVEVVRRDQDLRSFMGILMVARGPMPRDDLFRIYPDLEWGFDEVIGPVQRFVIRDVEEGEETYALCHPRFRDYMANHKLQNQAAVYREKLLTYCAQWQEHMPPSRYALRHYAGHLAEAEQWEELHALIATGGERQEWAEARHAADGSYAGYLADLQLAWAHADEVGEIEPETMSQQVQYALIESSIHSLTIPVSLLQKLVEYGVWTTRAGLDFVWQNLDSKWQAEALVALAPYLSESQLRQTLSVLQKTEKGNHWDEALDALATAQAIEKKGGRAKTLTRSERLPQPLQSKAIQEMLARLERLPEPLQSKIIQEMLTAAHDIENEASRFYVLGILASYLPEPLQNEAIREVLAAACAIKDLVKRSHVLGILASCLPEPLQSETIQDALAAARALQYGAFRSQALVGLFPYLPEPLQSEAIQEALAAARGTKEGSIRSLALVQLSPYLPEPSRSEAIQEALVAALEIRDKDDQRKALAGLAPYSTDDLLQKAMEEAQIIENDEKKVWALSQLAPYLSKPERTQVLRAALAAAHTSGATSDAKWLQTLTELAPHLPENLLQELLEETKQVKDETQRADILIALGPYLPENLLQEIPEIIQTIKWEDTRARCLVETAPYLPESSLFRACAMVLSYDQRNFNLSETLAKLALYLPEPERTRTAAVALAMALHTWEWDIPDAEEIQLGIRLPGSESDEALTDAIEAARSCEEKGYQAWVLADLALRLSEPERLKVLQEALASARTIEDADWKARVLGKLARHLPDEESKQVVLEALDAVYTIPRERDQMTSLVRLAPSMPEPDRTDALVKALTSELGIQWKQWDGWTQEGLVELASSLLSASGRLGALAAVLTRIRRDIDGVEQVRMLAGLALQLPEAERIGVFQEAFEVAQSLEYTWERTVALVGLIPHLPDELHKTALAAIYPVEDKRDRAEALVGLAPFLSRRLSEPKRTMMLIDTLLMTCDATDWDYSWTEALIGLTCNLPEPEYTESFRAILLMAREIDGEGFRAMHLIKLIPCMPESLWVETLAAARAFEDGQHRAKVLTELVFHLPEPKRKEILAEALLASQAMQWDNCWMELFVELVPVWTESQHTMVFQEALRTAQSVHRKDRPVEYLLRLLYHLSEPERTQIWAAAVTAVGELPARGQAETLLRLIPHLPEKLLPTVLVTAQEMENARSRASVLTELAPRLADLPLDVLNSLWQEAQQNLGARTRKDLLADLVALSPVIATLAGTKAVVKTFYAVQDVGRWWP